MRFKHFVILFLTILFQAKIGLAQTSFAPLAEMLIPSVVNISSQQQDSEDEPGVVNDLLFSTPEGRVALGSGFIVSPDGYIVTNRHVIEKASKISVIGSDNQEYQAQVIGNDFKTDVALIKIVPHKALKPVKFGNSDQIRVGDWVLAIGNPFGLGSSVTAGIISAKARDIDSGPYDNYLQTDASINQGNSGGPMFDMEGRVIGINTAIFSSSGNSVGIGFALPINQAQWVIEQLRQKGKVERSWLGITVKPIKVSATLSGLVVTAFEDANLGLTNGIQLGDVILKMNGQPTLAAKEFSLLVAQMKPNTKVELEVWRDGKIIRQNAQTAIMPDTAESEQSIPVDGDALTIMEDAEQYNRKQENAGQFYPQLGLTLENLSVVNVENLGEAALKGVKKGDRIIRAKTIDVTSPEELNYYIHEALIGNAPLRLDFQDGETGEMYFVEIPLGARTEDLEKELVPVAKKEP